MTCSPTWEEIMEKIPDGQTAQDRDDIVARVWQLKLGAELNDLDEGVLGRVRARIYVVEFQKQGLPHAHILVILAEEDKSRTRQIIDKMVSAELPDKEKKPVVRNCHYVHDSRTMWGCTSQRGLYERREMHKGFPKAPIGGHKRQCRWVPSVQTKTSSGRGGFD
ncbi:hypothetical protein PC129_g25304 [Phytophthora cactorum]|uniref:Helitron helicase-like domain-containing protein n=1 Tax=Phytophthora cactorum TaxID=29920 RepID=A0A8T1GPN7_9STRA|nr:hypothetical protein PC129_g25304 [Phytophthora cactorum]